MADLVDAKAIAARIGRRVEWVRAEAKAERIPAIQVGDYWRFDPDEIDRWLARRTTGPRDSMAMTPLSAKRQGVGR